MSSKTFKGVLLGCAALVLPSVAAAEPILGPDADLAALAASYERQQDTFARAENGQNLDAFIKADQVTLVRDFFAQPKEFTSFAGKHPFDRRSIAPIFEEAVTVELYEKLDPIFLSNQIR